MAKREYLKQAFTARRRIRELKEQIARVREEMTCIGSGVIKDSVQTSPKSDPMGDMLARKLDRIARCEAEIAKWEIMLMDIEDAIDAVENSLCREVLRARYISRKRWDAIAADTGYSMSHLYDIHSRAVGLVKL